jgi:hypothetical protein
MIRLKLYRYVNNLHRYLKPNQHIDQDRLQLRRVIIGVVYLTIEESHLNSPLELVDEDVDYSDVFETYDQVDY